MKYIILIVFISCQVSESVIYRLNDTEYVRMPPIYHLDDYDSCVHQTNGTYCYTDINLVSDTPSDLLQVIHEYSQHTSNHFNHSQLHYGVCLTKTCKHFYQESEVVDPLLALEACLNESLWKDYRLKAKLSNNISCKKLDDSDIINAGDICAGVFFVCLVLLNIVGSLYDFCIIKGGKGNWFLLSFSFTRNLKELITYKSPDPLKERLKGIYGVKTLSIMMVIFAHAPLPLVISTENPHDVERTYHNILYQLYFNGTLYIQTFFIITACLMAYNFQAYGENNKISWVLIPKCIIMRWLRLTPAYAVVLIFTLTWIRFIASGPLWEVTVGIEVADCRRDGWLNMIYLNNYIDNSQCMAQTWFLAANMQLYILGVVVCVFAHTSSRRVSILSALFAIGIVIPAIHTYFQDLDGVVLMAPEIARNFFVTDPTFNHSYKRSHTNLPGFVLGLALGNLIYSGLRDENIMKKYKKLGFLYYLTVPMSIALVLSGIIFYGDRPRQSVYVRTVTAALVRPLFALLMSVIFIGMVFKFENVYRLILEWRGWEILARVSYSAYLVHVAIIRIFTGMNSTLSRSGLAQCVKEASGVIFLSFLIAYPFWLFVEAPLHQACLILFELATKDKRCDENKQVHGIDERNEQNTSIESQGNRPVIFKIRL